MFAVNGSPFIHSGTLPSMIQDLIIKRYGPGADWARAEVSTALANALIRDFGFVSTADLEMKVQGYIDNGYIATVANQIPVTCDFDLDLELDELFNEGAPMVPPKYQMKSQQRGEKEDKFFCQPMNSNMVDNASLINTLRNGSDEDICALPNLSCSCPPVKLKCDVSSESLLYIQATHALIIDFGVNSLADIYRFLGMFGDRKCVWCKEKMNKKISCVSGTFQCINCLNKYKRIEFKVAFKAWLDAGCPAKHAVRI